MPDTKKRGKNPYENKGPNFIYILSTIILVGMIVSAIVVIKNVNQEYKIRQIAGDLQKYKYAFLSFNNVYSGIPGDLEKATFYWKEKTENGNGDRKVTHDNKEGILLWQHLSLSKLIDEAEYSGKWSNDKEGILVANYNIPKGSEETTGYYITYDENVKKNVISFFGTDYKTDLPQKAALSPADAYQLDLIMDDGMPNTGIIRAGTTEDGDCFVAGEYKILENTIECISKLEI